MITKEQTEPARVGILTFPCSTSHGAVLQMYALYEVVEVFGFCPEIIHYHSEHMRGLRHTTAFHGGTLRRAARRLIHWRAYRGFRCFERQMRHYPQKPFGDKAQLRALSPRWRAVICGSDQVWNPKITGQDLSYFLDFCGPETARIAYAPSFGFTEFPPDYDAAIAWELERFSAVSVREVQGQQKVFALTGHEPTLVLDPTFLLPVERWAALERPCKLREPYILYYALRQSDEMFAFCTRLAEEKQLPILFIGGNMFSNLKARNGMRYFPDADPAQWLYLISHARYVVTNSFHGLAFSISFRKDFFLGLSSLTNDRLTNLVSLLRLERQIIRPDIQMTDTDYSEAEKILPVMKERSMAFLRRALNDG